VGLASPLEPGDQVELTLKFEHAGDVYVVAQVRQP
jgi:copper(I)-binding protein